MRTVSRLLAFAAVFVLVIGCTPGSGGAAATVDGVDIPRQQLDESVGELLERQGVDPSSLGADERAATVEPLQRQLLGLLIQAQIIANLADERGIEVDHAAISEELELEIEARGGEDQLAVLLANSNLTIGLLRDVFLPAQQRVEGLQRQLLDDVDALEQRTARHILLETEGEALDVIDELSDGADFGELARERSIDPGSGAMGGDLGPAARGAYVGPFDAAVWDSDLGVVIGPIETNFGFHVIEVTDESTTPVDALGPQQIEQLVGPQLTALLNEALQEADVTIGPGLGSWDTERNTVVGPDQVGRGDQ